LLHHSQRSLPRELGFRAAAKLDLPSALLGFQAFDLDLDGSEQFLPLAQLHGDRIPLRSELAHEPALCRPGDHQLALALLRTLAQPLHVADDPRILLEDALVRL